MGTNLFTISGLVTALRLQRAAHREVLPPRGMSLRRRRPPTPEAGAGDRTPDCPKLHGLSYQALRDVFRILRVAGLPLELRLDEYREHLRRHHVDPSAIEERLARVRPFLAVLFGDATEDVPRTFFWPQRSEASMPPGPGYGIRFADGRVQRIGEMNVLTNQQADGLLAGGATLVWVDAHGDTNPIDVLVQDYVDDEEAS